MPVLRKPAGNPAQAAVPEKTVTAGGLGDDGAVFFVGQIINPGAGRIGRGDYIFRSVAAKMSVLQSSSPSSPPHPGGVD